MTEAKVPAIRKIKTGRGNKWKPTMRMRMTVEIMAAAGFSHHQIADRLSTLRRAHIDRQNLPRYFAEELAAGKQLVLASVAQSVYQTALLPVSDTNPPAEKLRAGIFILKTQGGWSETIVQQVVGPNNGPLAIEGQVTREWVENAVREALTQV